MAERGTRCPGAGLQCSLEGFINDCCVQLKRQVLVDECDAVLLAFVQDLVSIEA